MTEHDGLDGLNLFVRYDEGCGPPIVYLHGINSDASDWRVVIDQIGPGYRHIAPDLLGFGESPKPEECEYTADDHALMIDRMVDDLGIDEPFLLVGYSLGGDIAIRYASTYPHKLRRLFLLSTPFYLPPDVYASRGFGSEYFMVLLFQWGWRFLAGAKKSNNLLYQIADGRMEAAAKQFLRTDDVPMHWDIMSKNLTNCIAKATFVDDLPKLTMPVTFALGVRDVIVQPDQTPALKRLKPDMEIRRILGLNADHFMLVALPEKVAQEIMRDEIRPLKIAIHEGAGEPPIFLLHGLTTLGEDWAAPARALACRHEVIAPDLLGFGISQVSETLPYTLHDHQLALGKLIERAAPGRTIRLVGHNLGANVALAYAARHPDTVQDVVAFSPALMPPGQEFYDDAIDGDDEQLQVIAAQQAIEKIAGDTRSNYISAERILRKAIPMSRTIDNSIIGVNSLDLLERVHVPVTFVLPAGDTLAPRRFFDIEADQHGLFTVESPAGDIDMPFEDPAATVAVITPDEPTIAEAARTSTVKRPKDRATAIVDAVRSAENQLFWRGVLEVIAGAVLLAIFRIRIPTELILLAFAGWMLWEGGYAIVGSFGLRRAKKGWILYFALGVLGLLVGAFTLLNRELGLTIVGVVIAVRSFYVGLSNIVVARHVDVGMPKPKWAVYIQGFLGVAIAIAIILFPPLGGRLLRVTLGGYFLGEGVLIIGQAFLTKRQLHANVADVIAGVDAQRRLARS